MNNKLINKVLTTIAAILAITACGGGGKEPEPTPNPPEPPSPVVELSFGFSASVSGTAMGSVGALTKAVKDENVALRMYESEAGFPCDTAKAETKGTAITQSGFLTAYRSSGVGVFGYKAAAQSLGTAAAGAKITYDSNTSRWTLSGKVTWEQGEKMSFFAYAPYESGSDKPITAVAANGGSPTVSYSVPEDVAKQIDLLVAKSLDYSRPSANSFSVPLTFTHALATIEFKIGKEFPAVTIKSITFKGVKGTGKYNIKDEAWSETDGNNDYTLTLNKSFTVEQTQSEAKVNGDNDVMFMMPQEFADGTPTIEVVYALADKPETPVTFTAPIKTSTDKWEQGKKYTYFLLPAKAPDPVITTERTNTLIVDDIPAFTYEGGTNTINVKSETEVKTLIDGVVTGDPQIIRQPWSVEYSTDAGVTYSKTAPDWLTITRAETTNNAIVTVNAQISHEVSQGQNWVNEQGTNEAPYNLSNATGSATVENTANCYIVNGPGWYKLPLVYGNGIKGGKTNSVAYNSSVSTFVNHLDRTISDPYIYNNSGCAPSSASILWQDADTEVVSKAELCDNNTFLKFYIASKMINYDNAIVAVKDASGNIMWSWHIWATDYKLGTRDFSHTSATNDNGDGVTRTFMDLNLGYIPEAVKTIVTVYPARSCKARFSMTDSESGEVKTVERSIIQNSYNLAPTTQPLSSERHIYYQWGRKDPLPASGTTASGPVTYGASIKAPDTFYTTEIQGKGNWISSDDCYDAWHSGLITKNNDKNLGDVKTIYDPSPVGYCVPNSFAFCGFTTENCGAFNKGYTWEGSFFPAVDYREYYDGTVKLFGGWGSYWEACGYSILDNPAGIILAFCSTPPHVVSRVSSQRGNGCSIRAVKERTSGDGDGDGDDVDVHGYDPTDPDRNPDLGL